MCALHMAHSGARFCILYFDWVAKKQVAFSYLRLGLYCLLTLSLLIHSTGLSSRGYPARPVSS